jgi:hypothetical protein
MKLKLQFIIAIFIALVIYIPAVQAQAILTFSGGNGTPLSITLRRSVTYTINNTQCANAGTGPAFLFDEAGNPFSNTFPSFTGTITYSINGGAAQPITKANSGTANNARTTNDIYVFGNVPGVSNGSTVVLSAGTITTTGNVTAAPPADGRFPTFIVNNFSIQCSANGVSASPTAATVSISGRVMTASGRGIMNVRLSLTDSNGQVRTARTTSFGYYRFDDVQAGETYILSAIGKRYTFSQPVQVLNINEETDAVNFIADSK